MAERTQRKPILSQRTPTHNFDMFEAVGVEDIFADGVGRIYVGPMNSKLELFRATGNRESGRSGDAPIEERELFCRLTIPTIVLVEAMGNFLGTVGPALGQFDEASKRLREVINDAIRKATAIKT